MVESWVQRLVDGMQGTMKAIIKRAARHVNQLSLQEFIFNSPAQVALLGLQLQWTADTQVRLLKPSILTPAQYPKPYKLTPKTLSPSSTAPSRLPCWACSCSGPPTPRCL